VRSITWFLTLLVGALLAWFVLLPVLGFLLMVVVGALLLVGLLILAAPLLMKLPWFRNWIHVEETLFGKAIRFGKGPSTGYRGRAGEPGWSDPARDDVIDVEGREIPDDRAEKE
jgi:hypothetical protein